METYQVERGPVAKRNTAASRGLAVDLSSIEMPASIEDNTPQGALARQQIGATLGSFREMFASIGVQLGARYDESPIIVADEAPPADNYARYVPSAVPGGRAPHLWLAETRGLGDSLFDRFGVGFTLLNLAGKDHEASTIKAAAAAKKIPLKVLNIDQASARDIYQRDFVLIRPDQHVAWRGNRLPDPAATLSRLVGA